MSEGGLASDRWPGGPAGGDLARLSAALIARGRRPKTAVDQEWLVFRGLDLRGKTLLDVGAGAGFDSAYAAACGARSVVALEPGASGSTEGATTAARLLHRELGYEDTITIIEEPLERATLDQRFDVVLLNAAINHLDEEACSRLHRDEAARAAYRPFLHRLNRLCAPCAKLIIVDCSNRNLFPDLGLRNPVMTTINWRLHQPPEVWARLLNQAGFDRAQTDWLPITRRAGLGPLLSRRPVSYLINSVFRLVMEKPLEA